jgi:hypothetical protein
MPVDSAYSLQSTLERIRQRYALYFSLPAEARQGQQRTISVELASAALRRYPYGEVRYRREYYVSSTPSSTPGAAPTAVTQTQTPVTDSGDSTAPRRGRAVSQPDASHDGPLAPGGSDQPAPSAASPPSTTMKDTGTTNNSGSTPGRWRRVKPGEQE